MALRLRDRLFTRPVARAVASPSGILLAGAGVSAGIVLGLPVAAVAALGAVAWAGRVALSIPRTSRKERIDPFSLAEPWRSYVRDTTQAQTRFAEAVGRSQEGPLRERLGEIGERVETGAEEAWRIARHAQALSEARQSIDVAEITEQLARIQADADQTWAAGSNLAATAKAFESQLESAARMDTTIAGAESRLRLLDAQLDEAVTRAIELSVRSPDAGQLLGLEGDVDAVVTELESLRAALDETGETGEMGETAELGDLGEADESSAPGADGQPDDGFPSRPIMRRPEGDGGTASPG